MATDENDQKKLVKRIINLRESKNWTQKDLADRMDMNKVTMNKIENGNRAVTNDELRKMAVLFDVTTDYLLGINKTPEWATEQQVTDLKEWLDDPDANAGLSFGGAELTKEEKEKLKLSVTQIFWDRLKLERMPMPDARYMRKDGDDKK
jgi:transcriptional regulator with XRE-family HTH domain